METPSIKDQLCDAMDALKAAKRSMADYDVLKSHAIIVLELRQRAELQGYGKVKTKITPIAIANLIR